MSRCLVEIRAASYARGYHTDHSWITPDKTSYIVAVAPIPFGPAIARKVADLIETSSIPGLGNQFKSLVCASACKKLKLIC